MRVLSYETVYTKDRGFCYVATLDTDSTNNLKAFNLGAHSAISSEWRYADTGDVLPERFVREIEKYKTDKYNEETRVRALEAYKSIINGTP